jgi:hypothetical protein
MARPDSRRVIRWRCIGVNRFMATLNCGHEQETHSEHADGPRRVDRCWECVKRTTQGDSHRD